MPVTATWTDQDEQVLRLRSQADLCAQLKTAHGLERSLLYSLAADRLEWEQIKGKAVADYLRSGSETPRNELERKALSSLREDTGGYLIPTVDPAALLPKIGDVNPIRPYVDKRELPTGDLLPMPVETGHPGVRRVRETDPRQTPTSDMVIVGEMIPVHMYNITLPISSKLMGSVNFDPLAFVQDVVMRAFLVAESTDFITGTGVGMPEGIFVNGAIPITHSGSNSTITADAVQAMFYAVKAAFRANGYWMMNDSTLQVVKTLKDSSGQYMYEKGLFGLVPPTLLGRPILSCPDAPSVATGAYPIVFGDLSRYVIVDRTMLAVLVDPYSSKPNFVFDCVHRVGGQVIDPTAFSKMVIST